MTTAKTIWTAKAQWGGGIRGFVTKKVTFEFAGLEFVAQETTLPGGVEVYRVEDTGLSRGLEMFAGYLTQLVAKAPRLAVAAVEALTCKAVR